MILASGSLVKQAFIGATGCSPHDVLSGSNAIGKKGPHCIMTHAVTHNARHCPFRQILLCIRQVRTAFGNALVVFKVNAQRFHVSDELRKKEKKLGFKLRIVLSEIIHGMFHS